MVGVRRRRREEGERSKGGTVADRTSRPTTRKTHTGSRDQVTRSRLFVRLVRTQSVPRIPCAGLQWPEAPASPVARPAVTFARARPKRVHGRACLRASHRQARVRFWVRFRRSRPTCLPVHNVARPPAALRVAMWAGSASGGQSLRSRRAMLPSRVAPKPAAKADAVTFRAETAEDCPKASAPFHLRQGCGGQVGLGRRAAFLRPGGASDYLQGSHVTPPGQRQAALRSQPSEARRAVRPRRTAAIRQRRRASTPAAHAPFSDGLNQGGGVRRGECTNRTHRFEFGGHAN